MAKAEIAYEQVVGEKRKSGERDRAG